MVDAPDGDEAGAGGTEGRAAAIAAKPIAVRRGGGARPRPGRASRRRSLAFFAQLTDPQLSDEMSPARFDFLGQRRAHEAFSTQTFDQAVRSVNRRAVSRVAAAGERRARLGFALMTGDLSDNHQLNEIRWGVRVLDGGRIDPFSGRRLSRRNRCPGAGPRERARLNRLVARRAYTGVQDYRDWRGRRRALYRAFWDPNRGPPGGRGPYAAFPRYPGLMDRAQRPFRARGLSVPWYAVRGNHDGLALGRFSSVHYPAGVATRCRKLFPGAGGVSLGTAHPNPWALMRRLLPGGARVPPDPERRFVSLPEFKRLHRGPDAHHGFGFVSRGELGRSRGSASYHAFSPGPGLRFIGIDTVADGGGAEGNLDRPQYRWLARQLDRSSSVRLTRRGRLVRDRDPDRLIVVFGHHTLDTMSNPVADERLPACGPRRRRRCDADPRRSTPLHLGNSGRESLSSLLLRHPNVVLYVGGHIHRNRVRRFFRRDRRGGFWEVVTAGHSDGPQHSRLLELMRNRDGTLSVFSTLLNHAAPAKPPPRGARAAAFGEAQLGSISRRLAANAPWSWRGAPRLRQHVRGGRAGRPVELLLRDPGRLRRGR